MNRRRFAEAAAGTLGIPLMMQADAHTTAAAGHMKLGTQHDSSDEVLKVRLICLLVSHEQGNRLRRNDYARSRTCYSSRQRRHQAFAFAFGYIRGLMQAVNA